MPTEEEEKCIARALASEKFIRSNDSCCCCNNIFYDDFLDEILMFYDNNNSNQLNREQIWCLEFSSLKV